MMNILEQKGIYIAYPLTEELKPIYKGYKTLVNNKHTKIGKSEGALEGRKKEYLKTFNDEVEFEVFAVFQGDDINDLKEIESAMHVFLKSKFDRVGKAREWYDVSDKNLIKKYLNDFFKNYDKLFYLPEDGGHSKITSINKPSSLGELNKTAKESAEKISNAPTWLQAFVALIEFIEFVIISLVKIIYTLVMGILEIIYVLIKSFISISLVIVFGIVSILLALIGVNLKAATINSVINKLDDKNNDDF